jgi:hypothetical protein
MAEQSTETPTTLPKRAIRRFDVFAEVNRLKALDEGRPADEAKGYGIWLAKVVAGRRFGAKRDDHDRPRIRQEGEPPAHTAEGKFKSAGGEMQTDEIFDREVINRMGGDFYDRVFAPAIAAAVSRGEKYESFRDSIRATWKPAPRRSSRSRTSVPQGVSGSSPEGASPP